jgi:hypothetical protein
MVGKYFQLLPFVVNPTPQLLAKHSRHSVQPLNVRKPPELHLPFDSYPIYMYIQYHHSRLTNGHYSSYS